MSERPISGSYRPSIMGTHGMVASGHYLATQAGARILARGGNAIDAGVAAGLCLTVLHIDMVNLAGVAPIIVYLAEEDRVLTISGLGRWPKAASVAYFKEHCGGKIPPGVLRCITPGSPDAWITALERYGTLSLAEVMEEPLRLAAEGFPMHQLMASNLRDAVGQFTKWPSSAAVLMPNGRLPEAGEIFAQPDLARTIRRLLDAESGARRSGRQAGLRAARDLFYRGDIAREIAAFYASQGGLLAYDDLAAFQVQVEEPVRARFHEYEVFTCGPWCQGPVLAQVLTLLEPYDLAALGHNSPAYVHLLTEALKLVFADRERYYGDPEFVDVPMRGLLSESYAEARRQLIDPARAHAGMPPAGDPRRGNGSAAPWSHLTPAQPAGVETLDTSYVCAVDRRGNIFSATPSDGCLSAPVTPGHGARRVLARLAVLGRRRPSELGGARQAPAAHAVPGHRVQGRQAVHAARHAGRRRPVPGHAAGVPQRRRVRHGAPGRHRGAALRHVQLSGLLRAARVPRGRAAHRARPRGRGRRRHDRQGSQGHDVAGLDVEGGRRLHHHHRPRERRPRRRRRSAADGLRDRLVRLRADTVQFRLCLR